MNKVTAEEVAKLAAKEAVAEFFKTQYKTHKEKCFHNTKYLLENYKRIKQSVEEGVSDASDLEEGFNEDYEYLDQLFIDSIRKGKFRSVIMLAHVDKCLGLLQREQEGKNTAEKYRAFTYFYFDDMTNENIAEVFGCEGRTVRRWITELIGILSIYLFGVDALKL